MLKTTQGKFGRKTWDPAVIHWNGCYYAYCLKCDNKPHPYWLENEIESHPFLAKNHIHLYKSKDLNSWSDCGTVLSPIGESEIVCAGSVVEHEGMLYFFYAVATLTKVDNEIVLDQRLKLARSQDGINFKNCDEFSVEPDPQLYPLGKPQPSGGYAYAWRDPYLHYCDRTETYYLYIVTGGGYIWGTPPQIAVAKSKDITGPYELLKPALDLKQQPGFKSGLSSEFERIDLKYFDDKYYLFGSSWKYYLSQEFKAFLNKKKIPISNYNTYVFSSSHPEGPFELNYEYPVVTYRYGWLCYPPVYAKYFFADRGSIIASGWYSAIFRLAIDKSFKLTKQDNKFTLNYSLMSVVTYLIARIFALNQNLENFGEDKTEQLQAKNEL